MTILIKNILLINGTGQPAVKADVLVRDEKIAAIGYFPKYKADEVIDGMGTAYLTPGFVDVNSYSDFYLSLFSNPQQEDFLLQGITTIIGGQAGISLAPVTSSGLDLHKLWADITKVNVGWRNSSELLNIFSKKKLGVNFGTLTGHATMRKIITGDNFRDLSNKEIEVIKHILEGELKNGSFGVSFDLNFPLTFFSPSKEIKSILEVIEKYKAIASFKMRNGADASFSTKNLRNNFISGVEEIVGFSKETGARVQINNFNCPKGLGKVYAEAIEKIRENAAVADISYNLQTLEFSIMPLYAFLPAWARRGGVKDIKKQLLDINSLKKIRNEIPIFKSEDVIIFHAPGFEYLSGKSIKEFGETRGLNQKNSILELMRLTKLRATLAVKNVSLKDFDKALIRERSIISIAAASFKEKKELLKSKFDYNQTIPKLLSIISKSKIIAIEKVIEKLTNLPAKQYNLNNRGKIVENYQADMVLLRDLKVDTVIVNGKIAVREGELTGILNGKPLKRGDV